MVKLKRWGLCLETSGTYIWKWWHLCISNNFTASWKLKSRVWEGSRVKLVTKAASPRPLLLGDLRLLLDPCPKGQRLLGTCLSLWNELLRCAIWMFPWKLSFYDGKLCKKQYLFLTYVSHSYLENQITVRGVEEWNSVTVPKVEQNQAALLLNWGLNCLEMLHRILKFSPLYLQLSLFMG